MEPRGKNSRGFTLSYFDRKNKKIYYIKKIVELYWNRFEKAIEETSRKYGHFCFSIANNILRNKEDSEECVNDSYLHLWDAIPPQKPNSLKAFLGKITRNLALHMWEKRKAKKRGSDVIAITLEELHECIPGVQNTEQVSEQIVIVEVLNQFLRALEGKRRLFYAAYNVAMEEPESITEYCFHNASFYGDEDGLSIIRYGDVRGAAEYMGDYQVISEEEARKRLEEGQYFSIYSEMDIIGGGFSDENIKLVELTYLTGSNCRYYQPYYCFYVEAESDIEGISNYSLFYVPALMDEDLEQFSEIYPLGN